MRSFLLKSFLHLLGLLPLRVTHAVGAAIGKLLFIIPNRRQRTARKNLQLCFPDMSTSERERLLRCNLIELGKSVFEVGTLWTRGKKCMDRLVHRTYGEEKLQTELEKGRGVILAIPHLGAWEMVGNYCSMRYPFTALYLAETDSTATSFIRQARQRFGACLVPTDNNGIRALYKALERGETVAILPDQVPAQRSGSVFAPFFGIPASTMVLLSRLAMKTGASVMFTYAERLPHACQFDLHFVPGPAEINNGSLDTSVAAVNRMVEQCVRARPEQYQWFYKRFRVRPAGERAFY